MINNQHIQRAVSKIKLRSEIHTDFQRLSDIYVDPGALIQLSNENSQIFYGRRGTGKTHLLRALGATLLDENSDNALVAYIDCRTLGSAATFCETNKPTSLRCISLFSDIVKILSDNILEEIVKVNDFNLLDKLDKLTKTSGLDFIASDFTEGDEHTSGNEERINVFISKNPSIAGETRENINTKEFATSTGKIISNIKFPQLNTCLDFILSKLNSRLYVLIDEFSSIPRDIQPFFSEFIKKGLLSCQRVTIKIAALEHRSQFKTKINDHQFGFEVGPEIPVTLDLDEYFVFDKNKENVKNLYKSVLYGHINSALERPTFMQEEFAIYNKDDFARSLFNEESTFEELARAAEGVIRDLINIFQIAFFDTLRQGRETIDKKSIAMAAKKWYEDDKRKDLDEELILLLGKIINEVIGDKKARAFMLSRDLEGNNLIQGLVDARVLHLIAKGYSGQDKSGERYNIYSLDYGTYIDLKSTKNAVEPDFFEAEEGSDFVVPFDDKRSIRRIILNKNLLDLPGKLIL